MLACDQPLQEGNVVQTELVIDVQYLLYVPFANHR